MEPDLDSLLEGLPEELPTPAQQPEKKLKVSAPAPVSDGEVKRGRKLGSTIEGEVVSYTGPLRVFTLNSFKFPEGYSPVILAFKDFLDKLGEDGVTFEYLFAEADKAYRERGVGEAEVSKIKQKFAAINNKNTLTLKTIELICGLLGYEPVISFNRTSVPTLDLDLGVQQLDD